MNINIGVLGHVDSGKTELCRALSTELSTAALDKHPESKRRGITLDLGFSSFKGSVQLSNGEASDVQYTLVDCPGHASLIRTIIGGAQIIDLMLLVIDATNGIQTQTAECLLVGNALLESRPLLVILNKIDLIKDKNDLKKLEKKVRKSIQGMSWNRVEFVCTSALRSEVDSLVKTIGSVVGDMWKEKSKDREFKDTLKFLHCVDHCFSIKGQGTVLTGTVLQGSIKVGDTIQLSTSTNLRYRIKSMQIFHQNASIAKSGDRVGICLANLDSNTMERGWAFEPESLAAFNFAIARIYPIKFYKRDLRSRTKFHVSIGHVTVLASCTFFSSIQKLEDFSFDEEYEFVEKFNPSDKEETVMKDMFCLMEFEHAVYAQEKSRFIASNLSLDSLTKSCRLAFSGSLVYQNNISPDTKQTYLDKLKVYRGKTKSASIDRVIDTHSLIAKGLVGKSGNIAPFLKMKVVIPSTEDIGYIESAFGKTGKFKCIFPNGLHLPNSAEKNNEFISSVIQLNFKVPIFTINKRQMIQ